MFAKLARLLVRHPTPILLVMASLTTLAAATARHIRFDFSLQSVNAGDDDSVAFAEELKETFGYEDALLLVVVESTGERDVLDRRMLAWQVEIAAELENLPLVHSIQSLATLKIPRFNLTDPGSTKLIPLVESIPIDAQTQRQVRRTIEQSGMITGTLLSADRRVGVLLVEIDPQARDVDTMRSVVSSINNVLEAHPAPDDYRTAISGLPALRVDIVENLQADQAFLLPLAGLFFLLILALIFRRISGTFIPLLAIGVGLGWTVAIMAATGQSFNIMSNILPVLLLIIGVSNCVHIVSRYAEESNKSDGDRVIATTETMRRMSSACLITFLTTAIGFGSLTAARSEVLRWFGWQAALGLGLLYLCVMIILGTLFPFFRAPGSGSETEGHLNPLTRSVAATSHVVTRHPLLTLIAGLAVVLWALWASRGLVISSSMIETYEENHPTMRTMQLVEEKLAGVLPIEIALEADHRQRFLEPEVYRQVAQLSQFLLEHETVLFARSYVDIHQEVYASFRRRPQLRGELPTLDEQGESRIRTSAGLIRRVSESIHYNAFMSDDGTRARILLRVRDVGTRRMLVLIDEIEAKLQELFGQRDSVRYRLAGDAYLNAKSMDGFVRDLFTSLLVALVIIFAIIALLFRSVRIGLISVVPNVTPLALTLGYMGVRNYDLNAGNVIVFAISLGIAVDDTIHFLTRFREEMRSCDDVSRAIERAYQETGRAIVLTTLLIVCGLGILFFSDFVPTRRFAELTSLTMVGALLGDLFLLPACLMLFMKQGARPPVVVQKEN